MNLYFKIMIFIVALIISGFSNTAALQANDSENKKQIITQEQAAEYAAKLANEKFQKDFGISPFSPDRCVAGKMIQNSSLKSRRQPKHLPYLLNPGLRHVVLTHPETGPSV